MRTACRIPIVFALLAACGGPGVPAPSAAEPIAPDPPTPEIGEANDASVELVAVDVFDIDPRVVERVLARHGEELLALMRDDSSVDVRELVAKIRESDDFVYVEPALIGYFEDDGLKYYLTIDLVSRGDEERRMPFSSPPKGTYPDPGGLIAAWETFSGKVFDLLHAGEMRPERVDCPAFHCFGDHDHPALEPLFTTLSATAPAHFDDLVAILHDDHRPSHRAAAAYLLAFSKDGAKVVTALLPSLRDPSSLVRNNAMRVIAEIALHHPEVDVPLDPVLDALAFPASSDRNKAAMILEGLLARPSASGMHRHIVARAGPVLLALLRLEQPNNHEPAYEILKKISGQRFGARDHAAWESWVAEVPRDGG
jgi:hypothetical protein